MTWRDFNTLLFVFGWLLSGALFLAIYLTLVRIRTWAGWNVVALTVALTALGIAAVARRVWEWEGDGYQIFLTVCLLIGSFAMWQRVVMLLRGPTFNWRVLRRRKRDDK